MVILRGYHIGQNCLIGMNSVIMDGLKLGENSIVGAQSTVKAGGDIPVRSMVIGSPAKVLRSIRDKELTLEKCTAAYQALARACLTRLKPTRVLRE